MIDQYRRTRRAMTDGTEGFAPCPELLTEDELALFLRIPEVSNSRDHHNVIEHLKRYRNLPRIASFVLKTIGHIPTPEQK